MAYEALYTRARPKTLSQLIGQEHISNALAQAVSSGRLSHAYLLVGTRGTGKTSTARLLSKAMNCDRVHEAQSSGRPLDKKEIPCNKCDACRNFDSSPDNVEFDAASNRSVEDVTRLLSTAYLAPLRSRVKTFIIDEVHMLSTEAINSILKLIEEPPPNVAFFLATTEINKVPMTIRSRCQVLNFRLIPQPRIATYLLTLARRLNVTVHEDAAKKIARLAEGSMRDALTYLDQCYAMANAEITLENVNETLGLISDESLDEIISAVKAKDRAAVGRAITQAFSSGLSANAINESLITRLRDIEFDMLGTDARDFVELDKMIDALRSAAGEMYGSGIPDIILEMTLMKLAAPVQNFVVPQGVVVQTSPSENLDAGWKIFYDTLSLLSKQDDTLTKILDKATVTSFAGNEMTLGFRGEAAAGLFKRNQQTFEQAIAQVAGRAIKVSVVIDKNLPLPMLRNMPEPDRSNLANAIDIVHASDATKITD
ncbi:MAG: DNA polymerase III subunit gamma/tau [Selenomonadaceae bacterium]|nr:DNA polymerase III subunit gamma/tau [Selenomonadaceae bacterium]